MYLPPLSNLCVHINTYLVVSFPNLLFLAFLGIILLSMPLEVCVLLIKPSRTFFST